MVVISALLSAFLMTNKMKAEVRIFLIVVYKSILLIILYKFISPQKKILQNSSIDCDEKNQYIRNIFEMSNVFEIM